MLNLQTDEWGQVINNYENAIAIREALKTESCAVAIPLAVGHSTLFHISFVNLQKSIASGCMYDDGSSRGLQINIDRYGSYAIPWKSGIGEQGYICDKWKIGSPVTGLDLLPFFNSILTGNNDFENQEKRLNQFFKSA